MNISSLMLIAAILLNAGANVSLGFANSSKATQVQHNFFWILAILLFMGNFFCYGKALSEIEISISYPILVSGTAFLIFLVDWLFFGNRLEIYSIIGATLLVAGLAFMQIK